MIQHSFKEAIVEMMRQIAKEIPSSHKKTPQSLSYCWRCRALFCNSRVSDDRSDHAVCGKNP